MNPTNPLDNIQIHKFNALETAQTFAGRAKRKMMVLLGDDEKFWVVAASVAERLVAAGYEYAE